MGLSYSQIVSQTGAGESRVKMSLHRTRKKIAEELRKEGVAV
jgi:DNA-directed RNA polymerase specialized sigma24 family protein